MVVPSRMILSLLIRAIPGRCLVVNLGGWFQFSINSFDQLLEGRRESWNGTTYNALPRVSSLRGEVTASSTTPTIFIGPLASCGSGLVQSRAPRLSSLELVTSGGPSGGACGGACGIRPRSSSTSLRYSDSEYSSPLRSTPALPNNHDGMLSVQLPMRSTGMNFSRLLCVSISPVIRSPS